MYYTNDGIIFYQGDMKIGDREATQEEIDAENLSNTAQSRISEIDARFLEIDKESARPMRELSFDPSDTFAVEKLAGFETELVALRAERLTLI